MTKHEIKPLSSGFAEAPGSAFAERPIFNLNPDHAAVAPVVRAVPGALADLARLGYSEHEIEVLVAPKRTLARRRAEQALLTVEETDKALRLARIAGQAERVFGESGKANRWLRQPKRQLGGETPLAFLASEGGARIVEEMLFRIEHGMFA